MNMSSSENSGQSSTSSDSTLEHVLISTEINSNYTYMPISNSLSTPEPHSRIKLFRTDNHFKSSGDYFLHMI